MAHQIPHPCLSCALPDCDDASRACALRQAISKYRHHLYRGEHVTAEVRAANNVAYHEFYGVGRPIDGTRAVR